ncbi:unnamed protein product [Didymodactylos carnosus]|uniref:Uncharacterized protein n=1 Tax=Didymodactylos carnosus TaxID=1234261 RepID=A0A814TR05_9BILA|nr:unnamed protein product [Didymodactylos carnosus]CAF3929355.1 unnamed protein product [Didymodactylos carnosus]
MDTEPTNRYWDWITLNKGKERALVSLQEFSPMPNVVPTEWNVVLGDLVNLSTDGSLTDAYFVSFDNQWIKNPTSGTGLVLTVPYRMTVEYTYYPLVNNLTVRIVNVNKYHEFEVGKASAADIKNWYDNNANSIKVNVALK